MSPHFSSHLPSFPFPFSLISLTLQERRISSRYLRPSALPVPCPSKTSCLGPTSAAPLFTLRRPRSSSSPSLLRRQLFPFAVEDLYISSLSRHLSIRCPSAVPRALPSVEPFCLLYSRSGRRRARMTGRKIQSSPGGVFRKNRPIPDIRGTECFLGSRAFRRRKIAGALNRATGTPEWFPVFPVENELL